MAITMALLLTGLIFILGLVTVAQYFWAKRDAQKVADLAALSAAQHFQPNCGTGAIQAASANASVNWGTTSKTGIVPTCGNWDPSSGNSEPTYFEPTPANAASANAIQVVASITPTMIFSPAISGSSFKVKAKAVAINGQPIVSFSVGSRLFGLNTDESVLEPLLGSTLGTSLGLKLLSYEGVANSNISLLGLKDALHLDAGTVNKVLDTKVTLSQFLNAIVQALPESSDPDLVSIVANIEKEPIADTDISLGDTEIRLGDILNVKAGTSNPNTALDVDVNAADMINAALQLANKNHALALSTPINIPSIANVGLNLTVIEPPQIGIGGIGATAHTAQIRLGLSVQALDINLGSNKSLLNIPLYIEIAEADATIKNIQCHIPTGDGSSESQVEIEAAPGILYALLGTLDSESNSGDAKESWNTITENAGYASLVNVLGLAEVQAKSDVQLNVKKPPPPLTFIIDKDHPAPQKQSTSSDHIDLGTTMTNLLSPDTLNLKINLLGQSSGLLNSILKILMSGLGGILEPLLNPLFSSIDASLIHPLLHALGINIGSADVRLNYVNCKPGAQLVY